MMTTATFHLHCVTIRVARATILGIIVALAGILTGAPAGAQSTIKVLVNDSPITSYDIANRERFLRLTSRGRAGRKQAVNELIEEKLKLQEAKRLRISIADADVDRAFGNIAKNVKLTPAKLTAALKRQGINPDTLKNRIRADLAWGRIVRAGARSALNVTEKDVVEALGGQVDAKADIAEFKLRPILFVIPAKASNAYRAQRKREAESFRGRLSGCDQAQTLAKGLRDVTIRPLIRANEQQLGKAAEAVAATPVGKATRPRETDNGFELLAVCEKNTIRADSKESAEARNKIRQDETRRYARGKMRDLKSEAMIEYR